APPVVTGDVRVHDLVGQESHPGARERLEAGGLVEVGRGDVGGVFRGLPVRLQGVVRERGPDNQDQHAGDDDRPLHSRAGRALNHGGPLHSSRTTLDHGGRAVNRARMEGPTQTSGVGATLAPPVSVLSREKYSVLAYTVMMACPT